MKSFVLVWLRAGLDQSLDLILVAAEGSQRERRVRDDARVGGPGLESHIRWWWLAGPVAGFSWDYEGWDAVTARQIEVARNVTALAMLPLALSNACGGAPLRRRAPGGRIAGRGVEGALQGHPRSRRPVRAAHAGCLPRPRG